MKYIFIRREIFSISDMQISEYHAVALAGNNADKMDQANSN
jgi:hypothetical protein